MGGGGGGHRFSREELTNYSNEARKEIRTASQPEKRNVFISFDSDDLDEVNLLRGQAKNENNELEFRDFSVKEPYDSKNAEYIKRKIRERIKQTSATIVYLTDKTAKSRWVDWEIRESKRLGKGIIAMHKGDSPPSKLPAALTEFKIKPVKWNHDLISKAITKVTR